jgi:hypothetical protein
LCAPVRSSQTVGSITEVRTITKRARACDSSTDAAVTERLGVHERQIRWSRLFLVLWIVVRVYENSRAWTCPADLDNHGFVLGGDEVVDIRRLGIEASRR